ncbi:hypothetical protein D4764_14G0013380 [Takifugu flavidus]|uniref:Reverse transcriptase domain-containing protein n=1 Tax=Takifugu flavidus TaxID=433684 RepID=A0A5C6P7D3_9TELE|nr:hypothetical protein D4764_14G0013380 [Takifugu flavidus]
MDRAPDRSSSPIGCPQGTVLALFLFTLYNADFSYSSSSCHLQKFSDDSAAVGLITDGDDTEYRGLIQDFVDWSLRNNLRINANKTKELVVDLLRRNNLPPAPKGNSRLFLLRRLRSFGVQGPLLRTFYDSVVGSAIFYGIACWSSSIPDRDSWRMDRLLRRASSVLGCPLDSVEGTVLALFLFTLYNADFSYSSSSCHLQKFSDDSAAVGLITDGDDTEYRGLIQDFVDWSLRNNLRINANKTKELVVDLRRRNNLPLAPVNILGTDDDVVKSYDYLGVHLNNNLDWTHNIETLVKKGNSRLFLLRRLRSFGVQGPLLRSFYDSVVGSAIFYGIACWSSSITDRNSWRMDRLLRRASSVLGCPLDSVEVVGNGRLMAKLSSMLNNTTGQIIILKIAMCK